MDKQNAGKSQLSIVILFDGVCNLCNVWVNFVIERDPAGKFCFAALQSSTGQAILRAHNLTGRPLSAIVLLTEERVHVGSSAIIQICARLRYPWRLLAVLGVVPRPLRDVVYDHIARHRYRWFGKSDACTVPAPDLNRRFII
jgi:predicted DCC family thiol-disulfide oxidoreductase YuxK